MLAIYVETLRTALRDTGVMLLVLIAPLLYSVLYPLPYLNPQVLQVPVAVVDEDGSTLSRQVLRYVQASPKLRLAWVTGDEAQARAALQRREIEGYAVLPRGLKRDVLRGEGVVVPVLGDGAYFLLNKAVLAGFAEAVGTVSAGVEIRRLRVQGQGAGQAADSRSPVNVQLQALYNPDEGYGHYVVPAVAVIIVHQTLLMAVAMWVGTWFEQARRRERTLVWLARLAALATLGCASGAYFFGIVFWFFGFGGGGDVMALATLLVLLSWTVAAVGTAVGALLADRERALQLLLFSAIPMVFLSGFSWPQQALAAPLQWLAAVLPTTPAVQGFLRVNQMGASFADVLPQLQQLGWMALSATVAALACVGWRTAAAEQRSA